MLRSIQKLIGDKRKQLIFPIFLMSLDAIGSLVMYLMLYFTVIHLLNGSLTGGLVRNYTIVCLISIILRLIIYRSGYFLCFSRGAEMCSGLRLDLANHYRSLSLGYFNQNSSGYLLSTLTKDLSNFELVLTHTLPSIVKTLVMGCLILVGTFFIEVWSVNEGQQRFDTHVDKLMNYIRYWQASGESLKTSVRTRTRLEQLTGEGHYTGGTVPYGYKRVRLGRVNKKNQEVCDLVIDEAEAEIVRLIFHKYVYEGYGAQKLSHYLYEQGVVGRNSKNIPNTSIVRMIKNKGYTGYLINGAVETECPQLRIIEPELFEQAQELRQARTCERGGTSLGTSSKALLTGLVYCAHCGNRLSLTSSGRTHTYADGHTVKEVRPRYSCFYKIRHPGDCDGQSGYGVSKLDSIVEEVVRQIFAQFREVSRKKLLESVKTNDAARIQKKVKKIQKDLESKQKELDDLKAETILVIRGVSALDKELLGTLVAEAREALETLEKQLVQAQEEYEEATKTAKRSNYICNELFTWADVYDTANHDERRAILQQFIKEIRVRKDYEISITLNASFNQVEQLKTVSTYDGTEIFEEISEKGA